MTTPSTSLGQLEPEPHAQRPDFGNHCFRDHGGLDDRRTLASLNLDVPTGQASFARANWLAQR